mgnify:CR=1 FL=1
MRDGILIRQYTPDDAAALRTLVLQLHESLRPLDADLAPGAHIIDEHVADVVQFARDSDGLILLADDHGRAVGYLCLYGRITPNDQDELPAPYSFMAELYVLPEYQRQGIGRELVARAEAHARELGACKIELKVLAQNTPAQEFYTALGYAPRIIVMRKKF